MPASRPSPQAELPSPESVQRMIRQLSHPAPTKRQEAVGKLTLWGPVAFDALSKVADGPNLEAALLARDILRELGEVVFVGAEVTLSVDRPSIRWNEPVSLTVTVHNPTLARILLPWPAETPAASQPAVDDFQQVAAMMDVADFLAITNPAGEEIELRVDPIEQDTAVERAIQIRAGDNPPYQLLPAGKTSRLTVPAFNRGWARYPLLEAGTHTVRFEYQPEWKDPAWTQQGLGRVQSNTIKIEVTQPAPAELQRARRPLELIARQESDRIIAELHNVWDAPTWVNLNLNGPMATHAALQWWPQSANHADTSPFTLQADATGQAFDADRLIEIAPGAKTIVSETPVADIAAQLPEAHADGAVLSVRYVHIPAPADLRRALRDAGRRGSVPAPLFSGTVQSDAFSLRAAQAR